MLSTPRQERGSTREHGELTTIKGSIRMAPQRWIPDCQELKKLLDKGMTHQQIATWTEEHTGVRISRSSVSSAVSRCGLADRRPRYEDHVPWTVRAVDSRDYNLLMLRTGARIATGDKTIPELDVKRYKAWKKKMDAQGLVVNYDPNRPEPFHAVYRRPEDGDGMIRRPTVREPFRVNAVASLVAMLGPLLVASL